ncbi:hypothetical protein Tco_0413720 [Tanacetum coccineum]
MAALQAELQVTKGLIQAGRYGGGGETTSPIPRSMRLDVPKFSRTDSDRWIFSITEYFTLLSTPVDQRLRVVGFNLKGDAAEWFRWMSGNNLITDCDGFLESVRNRFGPYEDANADQDKWEDQGDALESGDISTLNFLVGNGSPRSLQLWGTIGSGNIHVLIDNESTRNFVQLVGMNMQGLAVEVDLYVLSRKGLDVVLGIRWLQKLGKVTHEYGEQIEFILEDVTHTLWDPGIKIIFFRHHIEDKFVF